MIVCQCFNDIPVCDIGWWSLDRNSSKNYCPFNVSISDLLFAVRGVLDGHTHVYILIVYMCMFSMCFTYTCTYVQAARLTSECRSISDLGLEIGARPFVFSDTPQLVLDSFINYTAAVNYKVSFLVDWMLWIHTCVYICFKAGLLQCLRDVPQRLMF